MRLHLSRAALRPWRTEDAESLAAHANNANVWINLRDAFPNPYSLADANRYIELVRHGDPPTAFAIEVDGRAAGSIAFTLQDDVERVSAEIGYFLGEEFWGRGIMTEAVRAVTAFAFGTHELTRMYAVPFEWNAASMRVLEKAGYQVEGRMRRSAIKDGRVIDQVLYARLR